METQTALDNNLQWWFIVFMPKEPSQFGGLGLKRLIEDKGLSLRKRSGIGASPYVLFPMDSFFPLEENLGY